MTRIIIMIDEPKKEIKVSKSSKPNASPTEKALADNFEKAIGAIMQGVVQTTKPVEP